LWPGGSLHGTQVVLSAPVNGDTAGNTERVRNELAEDIVAAVEDLCELHAVQRRNSCGSLDRGSQLILVVSFYDVSSCLIGTGRVD